jgi:hypothetical protein
MAENMIMILIIFQEKDGIVIINVILLTYMIMMIYMMMEISMMDLAILDLMMDMMITKILQIILFH